MRRSAGFALTRLIDEPMRRRLAARIAALWPPGPHALAAVAAKAVDAMFGRTRPVVELLRRAGRRRRTPRADRRASRAARTARRRDA